MIAETEKPHEIIQLPDPNLKKVACPQCRSLDVVRVNSFLRKIRALGTKTVQKFVEFESIHLKCKSCSTIFPLKRDGIVPGLSATKDVLETVLLLHFDFQNSAKTIVRMMRSLYSVKLKRGTILKWARIYGKEHCRRNEVAFKENFETCSGHLAMDGTFPRFGFDLEEESPPSVEEKKAQVPWLRLTALPGGRLLAIWEEVRTSKK